MQSTRLTRRDILRAAAAAGATGFGGWRMPGPGPPSP
ncbi:twin-arginine translocation signal domain-containing protein [Ramlibacter terrae]|uniref:Twin-arginine translocation signal domain-containing protein n=1 Tax=Ramlibacter terrae TaxID=2732511 RepID=A0ABX6P461_9BURK|nr:twin-arginine translocation signal domain-containing protein [Ramlibacter terrae]